MEIFCTEYAMTVEEYTIKLINKELYVKSGVKIDKEAYLRIELHRFKQLLQY